jgi:hypothetical protein
MYLIPAERGKYTSIYSGVEACLARTGEARGDDDVRVLRVRPDDILVRAWPGATLVIPTANDRNDSKISSTYLSTV